MLTVRTELNSDKAQVMALWGACFHDSKPFTQWFFTQRWLPEYGIVAEEDGKVAAAMQGFPYTVKIRGRQVRACILSGVSTQPDKRRRGLMASCLSQFMHAAARRGEAAVFSTPAALSTYYKFLHYPSCDTALVRAQGDKHAEMPAGVSVITPDANAALTLLPVYTAAMSAYSGAVCRTGRDMALKLADYSSDGGLLLIAKDAGGRPVGYAEFEAGGGLVTSRELAALSADVRNTLLSALLAVSDGLPVTAMLPPDGAELLPGVFSSALEPTGVMGAADIPGLLRTLAGFDDATVSVYDSTVPANNGVFSFSGKRCGGAPDVSMDAGRLMQLLNGYTDIKQLAALGQAEIHSPQKLPLLSKRLPKLPCYTVETY